MALFISNLCINCWACVDVCPSLAIEPKIPHFHINPRKCSECEGHFTVQQCASICPIERAIVLADGTPANPAGSLTGIAPMR